MFLNEFLECRLSVFEVELYRRRVEISNDDDDPEDDVEFAPRKAIKLEDGVHSAGNCSVIL